MGSSPATCCLVFYTHRCPKYHPLWWYNSYHPWFPTTSYTLQHSHMFMIEFELRISPQCWWPSVLGPTSNTWCFNLHQPPLAGGWPTPLWKIWKSVGIIIPNIWKNKRHVPNHQPVHYWWLDFPLKTSAMGFHPRSVLPASTFAKRPGDPGCSRWPSKRRSQHCGIRTYIANLGLLYVQILCVYIYT